MFGLASLTTSDPDDFTAGGLTIGTDYYLRVYGWSSFSSAQTTFDVCIGTPPPPPANDECVNAIVVTETDFNCTTTVSGTTVDATQSSEVTLCSTFTNDDDVWYSFTPLLSSNYNFELSNTTTGTYVHVYSGTCAGGLVNAGTCFSTTSNDAVLTAGTTYLVQVHTSSSSLQSTFDLCIFPDPTCAAPSNLTASAETLTGADLAWTENGTATLWDIEIVLAGATPTGTPTDVGVTNPYTWTGGMASTDYDFYVRADCGAGDVSPFEVGSFTTACDVVTVSPQVCYDFESGVPETCWSEAADTDATTGLPINFGSGDWASGAFINNSAVSGLAAQVNLYDANTNDWLFTPTFDLTMGAFEANMTVALTDWNVSNGPATNLGSDDTIEMLASIDAGASWTVLMTWDATSVISPTGDAVTVDLASVSGNMVQLAFKASEGVADDAEDVEFFIDNLCIDEVVNPCPPSLTLTGPNSGDNSDASNQNDNESSGNITSNQTILMGSTVDYDSATDIDMINNFEVEAGATFEAFIDGCNNGGGGSNIQGPAETNDSNN